MDRWNRSEGEGGLQDSTLDGIASEARGVLDVEVRRGDRNVVGDLELVPDFPSEGGLVAFEESVVGADEGRLTNSSTQVVALQEDVRPLETDVPGLALSTVARAHSFDTEDVSRGLSGVAVDAPTSADRRHPVAPVRCVPAADGPGADAEVGQTTDCLLYTSPSPRDGLLSRMPSSA